MSKLDLTPYDKFPKVLSVSGQRLVVRNYYNHSKTEHYSFSMMPFQSDYWRDTAARLKIKIPFTEIVTRDMGKSQCSVCAQKYEGSAPEGCQRMVRKVKTGRTTWEDRWEYEPHVFHEQSKIEVCGGEVKWDHDKEFKRQSHFFGLLESLNDVRIEDSLTEFEACFPAESLPAIRTKVLEQRMQQFEMRCTNAFQQISSKMSQAGQALQF